MTDGNRELWRTVRWRKGRERAGPAEVKLSSEAHFLERLLSSQASPAWWGGDRLTAPWTGELLPAGQLPTQQKQMMKDRPTAVGRYERRQEDSSTCMLVSTGSGGGGGGGWGVGCNPAM